jgi:hypothetical protein
METRTCSRCGETKPVSDFGKHKGQPNDIRYECKKCSTRASAEWKKRNPEKNREAQRRWHAAHPEWSKERAKRYYQKHKERLNKGHAEYNSRNPVKRMNYYRKHKFGMPYGTYEAMLAAQDGVCAICGSADPKRRGTQNFCVDHCHTTGKVRGLLCYSCNTALGHLNDDPEKIRKLISYLSKYSSESTRIGY